MLSPKEINHLQIPLIRKLQRKVLGIYEQQIGHTVDPNGSEFIEFFANCVLQNAGTWRDEIEGMAGPRHLGVMTPIASVALRHCGKSGATGGRV